MEQSMVEGIVREGNRKCALCESEARMYCKSDDAMLCWDCDARVHGANFLVARHTRVLLCRSCRTPTTWKASGSRLTPTISLCSRCCFGGDDHGLLEGENQSLQDEEEDEQIEIGNKEEEEEEEERDNQVVPWGMPIAVTITPPVASSSSSDGSTQKRVRNDPAEQSTSSRRKDDEINEPISTRTQQMEFDRSIKRIGGGDKGVSKAGRHLRLRRERKLRSTALSHASVSADCGCR